METDHLKTSYFVQGILNNKGISDDIEFFQGVGKGGEGGEKNYI